MVFARWSVVACSLHAILCIKYSENGTCGTTLLKVSSELSNLKALHISSEFDHRLKVENVLNKKDLKKEYAGRTLYIQRDYMSSEDMEGVGNMKNLADLSISCKIEPGSLFNLRKLEKLTSLDISCSNELSSEDFSEVKKIKGLRSLKIATSYCKDDYMYRSQYSYTNNVSSCMVS